MSTEKIDIGEGWFQIDPEKDGPLVPGEKLQCIDAGIDPLYNLTLGKIYTFKEYRTNGDLTFPDIFLEEISPSYQPERFYRRRIEPTTRYDWSKAPEWATVGVTFICGLGRWFEIAPTFEKGEFEVTRGRNQNMEGTKCSDPDFSGQHAGLRDTLEQRPERVGGEKKCAECKGHGYFIQQLSVHSDEEKVTCPICYGTGLVPKREESEKCKVCKGMGGTKVDDAGYTIRNCEYCNGTGLSAPKKPNEGGDALFPTSSESPLSNATPESPNPSGVAAKEPWLGKVISETLAEQNCPRCGFPKSAIPSPSEPRIVHGIAVPDVPEAEVRDTVPRSDYPGILIGEAVIDLETGELVDQPPIPTAEAGERGPYGQVASA